MTCGRTWMRLRGDLLDRVVSVLRAGPACLRPLLGKPAALLAVALTLTSALTLPGIIGTPSEPRATLPPEAGDTTTEESGPPNQVVHMFRRQEQVRDNEVYIKTKYEWGSVESYEEETEVWIKAWDSLEMEMEYERVVRTPDYNADLKWKVEIEVETEVITFRDLNGNGGFDPDQDEVISERRLSFKDIQWFLDQDGERSTFVMTEVDGLMEAVVTIYRGLTEPDGTADNEPWGSFSIRLIPLCEESTHVALKVKVMYEHPDYRAEMEGYLVSDCSGGLQHSWSFPRP